MDLPHLNTETLARLRMQECQGTLIGGMVVAGSAGMDAEEFGYQMMVRQRIRWEGLAGNLSKIARIFAEHFDVTYGFGAAIRVDVDVEGGAVVIRTPSLADAALAQLAHWGAQPEQLLALQAGFWRAVAQQARVQVKLEQTADGQRVRLDPRLDNPG